MTTNVNKIALLKDEIITVEKDISFHNTQVERLQEQLEELEWEVAELEQLQDEIENPDDYVDTDLKDLESSQ